MKSFHSSFFIVTKRRGFINNTHIILDSVSQQLKQKTFTRITFIFFKMDTNRSGYCCNTRNKRNGNGCQTMALSNTHSMHRSMASCIHISWKENITIILRDRVSYIVYRCFHIELLGYRKHCLLNNICWGKLLLLCNYCNNSGKEIRKCECKNFLKWLLQY